MKINSRTIPVLVILLLTICTLVLILFPQSETSKVINYYKKEDPNPEKLKAAQFLIENLNEKYSYHGTDYEKYRNIYKLLGNVPKNERDQVLRTSLYATLFDNTYLVLSPDKKIITTEFLIKHIDIAYSTWKNSKWNKEVSFENFCEYILPYKCGNEGISDYFERYHSLYSPLLESIFFKGGDRYYAIDNNHSGNTVISIKYNNQQLIKLTSDSYPLHFRTINSSQEEAKTIFIQYSNVKHWNDLQIIVNSKDTIYAKLKPLDSLTDLPKHPLRIQVQFQKGENSIQLSAIEDTLAIEYIEVVPFEKYYRNDINFKIRDGANYFIINASNNKCLEIAKDNANGAIYINDRVVINSENQCFNIQNSDYGFFAIIPTIFRENGVKCLDIHNGSALNNTPIILSNVQKQPQQSWAIIPIGNDRYKIMNKMSGKSLDISSSNMLVQNEYNGTESQHWFFKEVDTCTYFNPIIHVAQNSILEATRRIAEEFDFNWQNLNLNLPEFTALDVLGTKVGNCYIESQFQLYILRSLGIPTVIDFMPLCALSTNGHDFNSIIGRDNRPIYCQIGITPGTGNIKTPTSKVYRKTFSINKNSLAMTKNKNQWVPPLFNNPHLVDVTSEYIPTANVTIDLFDSKKNKFKQAYLCVNNKHWLPVSWGRVTNNKCQFNNLGLGILYLPVYFHQSQKMEAAGYPFILEKDSTIRKIVVQTDTLQTLVLKRKFLWGGGWSDGRMDGGKFQGANKADFSDSVTLHTFTGNTEPIFYNLPVENQKKFSYVRYIGANGSYSTLSELSFKDENNNEIYGTPIGTQGSYKDLGNTIDKAFDKDILTFFEGPRPDSTWVGLKFQKPERIRTIRFIPRNDGNCIEIGDEYELKYWNNFEWLSLGRQIAKTDSLVYNNCPINALYILHNYTKGFQERVFIVDQGKQIFY